MKLHQFYKDCYIYKTKDKNTIPFELRPLCYEMHGKYLDTKVKWNRNTVINYFNMIPPARMIFIINFEKNKDYHLGKVQSNDKMEVTEEVENAV